MIKTRCRNLLTIYWTQLTTILYVINRTFQVYIWTYIVVNEYHVYLNTWKIFYV